VLVNMETVHYSAGRAEQGISLLYRAIDLIDPDEEPFLVLCVWHNLIDDLADLGRFVEARDLMTRATPVYGRFQDLATRSRRTSVEGKIARGLGQPLEAEALFLTARNGFLDLDMPFDAALISLDLALLYAGQKRILELRSLAEEMLQIFAAHGIQREALASAICLQHAVTSARAG